MSPTPRRLADLLHDDAGAIFTEYTVILVLVAIACIGVWNSLHEEIREDARTEYVSFGYPPSD